MNFTSRKNIVLIDTSTPWLYLSEATWEDKSQRWISLRTLTKKVSKENDDWLSKYFSIFLPKGELDRIETFYLGHGPGSFTGLKISFAFFQTLSLLHQIPIATFSSIGLWHKLLVEEESPLLIRANRNMYFGYYPIQKVFSKMKRYNKEIEILHFQTSARSLIEWQKLDSEKMYIWKETWRKNEGKFILIDDKRFNFILIQEEEIESKKIDLPFPKEHKSFVKNWPQPKYGLDLPFLKKSNEIRKI